MTPNHATVALVTGAGNGIGFALVDELLSRPNVERVYATCRRPAEARSLERLGHEDARLTIVALDVTDDASLAEVARRIRADGEPGRLDLVINTAGILHAQNGLMPERRLTDVNADYLRLAFDVNALGALRLAKALEPLLRNSETPIFTSLSARVGSIEDNRLGGWYAYRASKAALNMLLKTLSIEWSRLRPAIVCAALHPGTVATRLSAPFTGRRDDLRVFSPADAATNLLAIVLGLTPAQTGRFFAWDGSEIPW